MGWWSDIRRSAVRFRKRRQDELFVRRGGRREDADLHDFILRNRRAQEASAEETIERAVREDGLDRETARRLYGIGRSLK